MISNKTKLCSISNSNPIFVYRFGFNGQEKDNEIGTGIYTAEFWEYDARIGRRWNLDPKPLAYESPYSTNHNNPILNSDPKGDFGWVGALGGFLVGAAVEYTSQAISNYMQGKPVLENIDFDDVLITATQYAYYGATGGIGLLIPQVNVVASALRTNYDWQAFNKDNNFKFPGGVGKKAKAPMQRSRDAESEMVGLIVPGSCAIYAPLKDAITSGIRNAFYYNWTEPTSSNKNNVPLNNSYSASKTPSTPSTPFQSSSQSFNQNVNVTFPYFYSILYNS